MAIAHYDDSHARLLRRDEVLHIFSQQHTSAGRVGTVHRLISQSEHIQLMAAGMKWSMSCNQSQSDTRE